MFKINLKTLSQACEKNPKLMNICKGHSQILCRVALEQSGYTEDLSKWQGRYCYIVKHLIDITLKAKSKISLKQKDKLLQTIEKRRLDIPKSVIKFIEKNHMKISKSQKGKGPYDPSIFDKYLEELEEMEESIKKDKMYEQIDNLLKDLNDQNVISLKIEELNKDLANADTRTRPQIIKQRNLLQQKLSDISSNYPSPASSDFNPFKGNAISPASLISFNEQNITPIDSPDSDVSNIFKTRKYIPRITNLPLRESPKKSRSIFSTDVSDGDSYFSDDQSSSYTFASISENLPDILKSAFTSARLFSKHELPEPIVVSALSDYKAKNNNELTIFSDNFVEVHTIYGNGKVIGKVMDTDNIVNIPDMFRYGYFPITVFLPN